MTPEQIMIVCAKAYGVAPLDLKGGRRDTTTVRARFAFIWVLRNRHELPTSYSVIGRILHRHHTTIIDAVERAEELRKREPFFRTLTDELLPAARLPNVAKLISEAME